MKNVVHSKNFKRAGTCFGDRGSQSGRVSSFSNSSLVIVRASSMGMLVQSALTSSDTIILSSSVVWAQMNSENYLEFLQCCLLLGGLLCVGDGCGCGDGLVVVVLFCRGDSFEEDLHWEPKPRVFVDLVVLDDEVDGVTLLETIEALREAFFFSTSVELNTKGVGHEMMDSNTSLPSILTPKHFLGCFCNLFRQIGFGLHLLFRQVFGTNLW